MLSLASEPQCSRRCQPMRRTGCRCRRWCSRERGLKLARLEFALSVLALGTLEHGILSRHLSNQLWMAVTGNLLRKTTRSFLCTDLLSLSKIKLCLCVRLLQPSMMRTCSFITSCWRLWRRSKQNGRVHTGTSVLIRTELRDGLEHWWRKNSGFSRHQRLAPSCLVSAWQWRARRSP